MQTSVPDELIDSMLKRAQQMGELTEEVLRQGLSTSQACSKTPLDQMWAQETPELRGSMERAQYDVEMTEHVVERFHAVPIEA